MNYFSANDVLFSLGLMQANYTTQILFEIDQTIITFDDNRFLPQLDASDQATNYRLNQQEQRTFASTQNIVQLIIEQGES